MATRMSKADRIKAQEALTYTDAQMAEAQKLLSDAGTITLPKITCSAIPFRGGGYGYQGKAVIKVNGEDVNVSVNFSHPSSDRDISPVNAALHKLATVRAEGLRKESSAASMEERIKAMPKAERLAFLARLAEGLDDDDSDDDDDDD